MSVRNPSLKDLRPEDAQQARCCRCRKVVMVARTRGEMLPAIAVHYDKRHPLELDPKVSVLLEGETGHFVIEKAPPARCDLCCIPAERPWWVWVTPSNPEFEVDDPEWCVCDHCHPLVVRRDVIGLCKRVWEVGSAEFVVENEQVRKEAIRQVMTGFLSNVDPQLTWCELA